ncbi:MAG: GtrA family protein [Pseudomonadota bacterium]
MKTHLHFIGIAGIGWLVDTGVFYIIVSTTLGAPFLANIAGGVCGASITFLGSRKKIFLRQRGRTWVRLAIYILYTLGLLIVASAAVHGLTASAHDLYPSYPIAWIAVAAKIIVTPGTLALNFLVARFLNTR